MSWQAMDLFAVRSTGFPREWMESLRFAQSHAAILSYQAAKSRFDESNRNALSRIPWSFPEEESAPWRKILKKLKARETLEGTAWLSISHGDLRDSLAARQSDWIAMMSSYHLAKEAFERELMEKRQRLWEYAKRIDFQNALLEINPEFYKHLQGYLQEPVASRNSKVRQKENTLFLYLTRFCTKPAICGTSGLTSRATVVTEIAAPVQITPSAEKKRAFFSNRFANALAQAWSARSDVQRCFGARLHPSVDFEPKTRSLRSHGWFEHPGMPDLDAITVSPGFVELWASANRDDLRWFDRASDEVLRETLDLIRRRWLRSELTVPLGHLDPLGYWNHLETRGTLPGDVSDALRRLGEDLKQFESEDPCLRIHALDDATEIFQNIAGKKNGPNDTGRKFYADKWIFFLEKTMGQAFEFSAVAFNKAVDDYAMALDLLAPQWLWMALKAVVNIRLAEGAGGEADLNHLSKVVQAYLQAPQAPLTEEMRSDPDFLDWAGDIQALMRQKNALLESLSLEPKSLRLDRNDPKVVAYREAVRATLNKERALRLPLYSSCACFQWLEEGHRLIFDSSILGNAMHLTIASELSLDRAWLAGKTRSIFEAMTGARSARHPVVMTDQPSKFTPWISPWDPVPYFQSIDTSILPERAPESSAGSWAFPGHLRLSQKAPLTQGEHLPRVEYGNAILQRETWNLTREAFPSKTQDSFEQFLAWIEWCQRRSFPREFYVEGEGPKTPNLYLCAENFFSAEIFFATFSDCQAVRVTEALPNLSQSVAGLPTIQSWTGFFYDAPQTTSKVP